MLIKDLNGKKEYIYLEDKEGVLPNKNQNTDPSQISDNTRKRVIHNEADAVVQKQANQCLIFGILSWVLYMTVIPAVICAVISICRGNKAKVYVHIRRITVGLLLSKVIIAVYIISIVVGIVCTLL